MTFLVCGEEAIGQAETTRYSAKGAVKCGSAGQSVDHPVVKRTTVERKNEHSLLH